MTELKEQKMEVGIKYKGYGIINEYGQVTFTPEQKGANQGKKKLLCEGAGYTVYTTEKKVIVHFSCNRKQKKVNLMTDFFNIMNVIQEIFRQYAF